MERLHRRLFTPNEIRDIINSPELLRDHLMKRISYIDPSTGKRRYLPYIRNLQTAERLAKTLENYIKVDEIERSLTYRLGKVLMKVNYGAQKILYFLFGPAYARDPSPDYLSR
jgi:hypothetical protein